MPTSYKVLTGLIALAGSLTLIMTGEVNSFYYIFLLFMLYGYYRLIKGRPQGSKTLIGLSSIGALLVFVFDALIITGDYLISVGHLSLLFHAIKSFDIKEPYDPLQVYFMALLQLVVASEFTTQMLFGLIIVFFIALFIFVMIMAHHIKVKIELRSKKLDTEIGKIETRYPAFLVITTVIFSIFFFIVLPRLEYGLWGKGHVKGIQNAGFSEKMDLSGGDLKLDSTVVMRVELRPLSKDPYYWRGMRLDYFDGKGWSNSFMDTRRVIKKTADEFIIDIKGSTSRDPNEEVIEQDILLEPVDSDVLFLMERPLSIKTIAPRLERDLSGTFYLPKKGARRIHYVVRSIPFDSWQGPHHHSPYLQILPHLKEKLKPFTKEILRTVRVNTETDKAMAIELFLKKNYTYSLDVPETPPGMDPVSYFLFEHKKGYCEHYASAMVLMLRSIDIPARIVTGFYGGQINEIGNYVIIRQKDAHSWVEAFVDGLWKRFDPTPPTFIPEGKPPRIFLYIDYLKLKWQRYVVNFSKEDQKKIMEELKALTEKASLGIEEFIMLTKRTLKKDLPSSYFEGLFFILLIGIFLLLFLFTKRFFKRSSPNISSIYYLKLKRLLRRLGYPTDDSSTAEDILKYGLKAGLPEQKLREFLHIYEASRFGEKTIEIQQYRELSAFLQKYINKEIRKK